VRDLNQSPYCSEHGEDDDHVDEHDN